MTTTALIAKLREADPDGDAAIRFALPMGSKASTIQPINREVPMQMVTPWVLIINIAAPPEPDDD